MDIKEFLAFTAAEFQEEKDSILLSTQFRDLSSWSSLNALIYISNIHDRYGALLSSVELSKSNVLNDIFNLIQQKV
ncbi:MAG: acyl carrier protein [Vicingaceae bacterium]|jgi:acyl carrier protein